jgi:ABC-type nickel/cobalt efflux system permease component RcnA
VAGPDHLAALLPLSVGQRLRAFWLGARWGAGHSGGVLLVGVLLLLLREQLDLHAVGAWAERAVGVMLIGLGLLGLRRGLRIQIHSHLHDHGRGPHEHLHLHVPGQASAPGPASLSHRHDHTALLAGTLHGIAGTAHILGVLPALALPGATASALYLSGFAAGTVLAMGGFAALVGWFSTGPRSGPRRMRGALLGTSALTLSVGVAWLVAPWLGRTPPGLL